MVRRTGKSDSGIERHWSSRFKPRTLWPTGTAKTELNSCTKYYPMTSRFQNNPLRYGTVRLCLPITASTQYVPLVPSDDPNMAHRPLHQDAWPLTASMGGDDKGENCDKQGWKGASHQKVWGKERSAPLKLQIRDRLPKSKALAMLAVWRWFGRLLIGELMPNIIQRLENGLNPRI